MVLRHQGEAQPGGHTGHGRGNRVTLGGKARRTQEQGSATGATGAGQLQKLRKHSSQLLETIPAFPFPLLGARSACGPQEPREQVARSGFQKPGKCRSLTLLGCWSCHVLGRNQAGLETAWFLCRSGAERFCWACAERPRGLKRDAVFGKQRGGSCRRCCVGGACGSVKAPRGPEHNGEGF